MKNLTLVPPTDIPLGKNVPTEDLLAIFRLCTQMEQLCCQQQGAGLAAVQLGIPWKLFIVLSEDLRFRYFLNCRYEGSGSKIWSLEGCLSLRTPEGKLRKFDVPRWSKIRAIGQELIVSEKGLELKDIDIELKDTMGIIFQHESDHGDQILISDIGTELEVWNNVK